MTATNPAVPCVSKDCFVKYFVEVPKLAQACIGYGLQPKSNYVEGSPGICQRALVLLPQSRAGNFQTPAEEYLHPTKGRKEP